MHINDLPRHLDLTSTLTRLIPLITYYFQSLRLSESHASLSETGAGIVPRGLILLCRIILRNRGLILLRNKQLDFVSLGPGIVARGFILLCRIISNYSIRACWI